MGLHREYKGYIIIPEPKDTFFLPQQKFHGRGYLTYFSRDGKISPVLRAMRSSGEATFVLTDYEIKGRHYFGAEIASGIREEFGRNFPVICFPEHGVRVPKRYKWLFDRVYAKDGSSLIAGEDILFEFLEKKSSR